VKCSFGPASLYNAGDTPVVRLDTAALMSGDSAGVLAMLQQGIASAEHAEFVARLGARRREGA
jgi:hypothetical protein